MPVGDRATGRRSECVATHVQRAVSRRIGATGSRPGSYMARRRHRLDHADTPGGHTSTCLWWIVTSSELSTLWMNYRNGSRTITGSGASGSSLSSWLNAGLPPMAHRQPCHSSARARRHPRSRDRPDERRPGRLRGSCSVRCAGADVSTAGWRAEGTGGVRHHRCGRDGLTRLVTVPRLGTSRDLPYPIPARPHLGQRTV